MPLQPENPSTEKQLRVGLAGYGLAGRVFHAPLLKGAGFHLAGIVTQNAERIEQAHGDFPDSKIVGSVEDLLSLDLDLIVVASANVAHAQDAITALKGGVHVVVDKPVGRTEAEVRQIADVADSNGRAVIPFFNRRWDSDALTIKEILKSGVLGEVFRLDSRFERYRPGNTPKNWREQLSIEQGGGLLLDLQPHLLSTAFDWFGDGELVYSRVRNIRNMADDDSVLVVRHHNGVESYLSASAIIGAPGPRIRLSGTHGTLVISDLDPQEAALRAGLIPTRTGWNPPLASQAFIHRGDEVIKHQSIGGNYLDFYLAVEAGIRLGKPWPVTITDAIRVAQVIDQAVSLIE